MAFSKPEVRRSPDFERIVNLPTRGEADYPENLTERLSALLRTPGGTQTLFPVQARALYELGTYGRLLAPISVGSGKSLITFLAPRVIECARPLLVIPSGLIQKTEREWREAAQHWKVAKHLEFMGYEFLGRVGGANRLEARQYDAIFADECWKIKNPRAAVTRRFARYLKAHPKTKFVPMSGTLMKHSIKEFAHLAEWALGDASPLPLYATTLMEWAEALDENRNAFTQRPPGVLLELFPGAFADNGTWGDDNNARARRVFQMRLHATPGVVVADASDQYTGSLAIEAVEYPCNDATERNFDLLRREMLRPDGWALSEAMQAWAVARQIAIGLHYAWDPAPPEEWLLARKNWAVFVRDFLGSPASVAEGVDSELQVVNGVLRGEIEDEYGLLADWQKMRPTFDINSVPVWHDRTALDECAKWLSDNAGICWVEHKHFAKELSKITGVPYFGAKGLDPAGNFIQDAKGPVIASIAANSAGRNLQRTWSKNLVTAPPSDSERWEQLIARTHRYGQQADTVEFSILVGCREHLEAIPRAKNSSQVKEDLLGFNQKLKIADITWPDTNGRKGPRWA